MNATRKASSFAILGAASCAAIFAVAQVTTFRVNVHLVNVFVNVTDAKGAPVADLEKRNFAVSEDGVPQAIAVFEKQTDVPLSMVLAVDTSGSTHKDITDEQSAARDFARAMLTPRDALSVFTFDSEVRQAVPFTSDPHRVEEALGHLSRGPATALYDTVVLAARTLTPRQGRRVLILVSDGDDTVSSSSFEQALQAAQSGEVILYSLIDVPIEADAGRDTGGEHAMITLSEETGGRAFYVDRTGLRAGFAKVAQDLRTQYLVGYYPRHPATSADPLASPVHDAHTIHVTLQNLPEHSADTPHYRTRYFRAPSSPGQ